MIDLGNLYSMQGELFVLMLVGYLCRKKLVGKEFQREFTALLMTVVFPCNIIDAFQMELTAELLARSVHVLAVSTVMQALALALNAVLFRRADPDRACSMKYTLVCSNAGALGQAVAEGLWSAEGVMLTNIYLIPQRLCMWSVGLSYYTMDKQKGAWRKTLSHPCILAMLFGMVLMGTGWRLPAVLRIPVASVADCTGPMIMLLIGMVVSEMKWKDFLDWDVLEMCALRLVIVPAVLLLGCRLFRLEGMATSISVLLAAMPAGSTGALLAARYDRDEEFAASLVTVSSLLSMLTIPLWGLVLTRFG